MVRSPVHANATRGKYETAYYHEVAKEFGHTALWRLMYLAGGCVAVLTFYLAAGGAGVRPVAAFDLQRDRRMLRPAKPCRVPLFGFGS